MLGSDHQRRAVLGGGMGLNHQESMPAIRGEARRPGIDVEVRARAIELHRREPGVGLLDEKGPRCFVSLRGIVPLIAFVSPDSHRLAIRDTPCAL